MAPHGTAVMEVTDTKVSGIVLSCPAQHVGKHYYTNSFLSFLPPLPLHFVSYFAHKHIPTTQVHVSRIHVAGLQRTKNDIVVEQVKDILHATSLQDLLMRSLEALQRLQELNAFKHVDIQLDTVKSEGGRREGVEVMFVVQEYGWLTSTIAANAGTQSGDAVRKGVCVCGCV